MSVEYHIYDKKFFQNTIKLEASSAKAAVAILNQHFHPRSVIDIGCGCGTYLKEFDDLGVEIIGYDGSPAAKEESLVGERINIMDLSEPFSPGKKYDLCLCLEVAEHLEESKADILVDTLVRCSDIVVFTAAIPGQGPRSIGHINEQPPEYWLEKFAQRKFQFQPELTKTIKAEMADKQVVWWIVQNLLVFKAPA